MASDPRVLSEQRAEPTTRRSPVSHRLRANVKRWWRTIEYSSAYLALIAAAKVFVVIHVLSLELSPAPLVGAAITFAVYANDRLVDLESDRYSNPRRSTFVRRYQRELYVLAAVSYGVGVTLSALGGPLAFGLALFPGGAWLVYAKEWVRVDDVQFTRLKEVPVASSVLVAVAWALPVVLVPILFADAGLTPTVWLLLTYFAFTTFVSTEISNVRDVESDRESGAETLPTAIGIYPTRAVLFGTALLTTGMLGYGAYSGIVTAFEAGVLAIGAAGLAAILLLLEPVENRSALALGAECTQLPVAIVFVGSIAI